jgi:hypothetical protein
VNPWHWPIRHVRSSQQRWPMPPQTAQVALSPVPAQMVPGAEQKRGTAVPPISQQVWPGPPHMVMPLWQAPVAVHMPALPPQGMPTATQSPSLSEQVFAGQP